MLRLRLLGEFAVEADGRVIAPTGSWRARPLLAWLALHPGLHLRGDLAARFWPDVLDSSARASLRNALWALRRDLGEDAGVLVATRERIGLQDVWTDVAEFDRLAAAGSLLDASALWQGEPLTGLEDDWAYDWRDELTRRFSDVCRRLSEQAQGEDHHTQALVWARRRAALDPLAEDAQRDLMTVLAAGGDRVGALEVYARLRDRLRRDLGISPSGATRGLAEQVRDAPGPDEPVLQRQPRTRPAPAPIAAAAGGRLPLPPRMRVQRPGDFVGRREELAQLTELLQGVTGTGARLAVVSGDPGIGKSRLAYELAVGAHAGGAVVLQGSCAEEALTPYQPFAEALGGLPGAAAAGPAPPWAITPADGTGEGRRLQSFEAVADLLASMCAGTPLLLVIEDLQWADSSSAALLAHVIAARPEAPMLVLATCRGAEVAPESQVGVLLSRLHQDGLVQRLTLGGLTVQQVRELLQGITGTEPVAGLDVAVHAETEGNPFFAAEMARQLGADPVAHRIGLPESVREVIERRLAVLGPECLRLLTVAAVIGREFELQTLEPASELGHAALDEALEEAMAARLIVELPGLGDRFAFTHTLIRRTLSERLTRSRRRRVHARIAEALQAADGGPGTEARIAYHLCEAGAAGDPALAVEHASRAAEEATAQLAYAEAIQLYTRALPLLAADDPRRRKMALKRAVAFQALGHQYAGDASHPGPSRLEGDAPALTT